MSSEEDTELRDLVAQTLEVNGCLPKIRAELRANIFLALDEDETLQKKQPMLNKKVKNQLETQDGHTVFCLVREFLEFFDLDFTISVYEPESYLGTAYEYKGRSKLIENLGISELDDNSTIPLLLQLIQLARKNSTSPNVQIKPKTAQPVVSNGVDAIPEKLEVSENGHANLNETFELSSPSTDLSELKRTEVPAEHKQLEVILSPRSVDSSEDTYEGTSSIAEDDTNDKSSVEFSPPVVKDGKTHSKFDSSFDKLKLSPQKTEKLKSKSSLSSLADLPPLQLSKSRNDTVLLPSLYSKEFREKSSPNVKFFDVDADNYEEDFISDTELNLNKTFDGPGKLKMEKSNNNQNPEKNKTENLSPKASGSTSDDLNSNFDDILNSPTSN